MSFRALSIDHSAAAEPSRPNCWSHRCFTGQAATKKKPLTRERERRSRGRISTYEIQRPVLEAPLLLLPLPVALLLLLSDEVLPLLWSPELPL